ncbi:ubiquinone/menaquinone biosynthesis-related protein [Ceratocystis lukuohia]|uniref:Ubiquinone/menaquinone biosynthesis-related protein n=1 Tax=Ceratocystis lukuohia TaxID=2019550 RepID=A0ABR4MIT8_9PEZI
MTKPNPKHLHLRQYASSSTQHSGKVLRAQKWPLMGALGVAGVMGYYFFVLFPASQEFNCGTPCVESASPTGRPTPASNMSAHDFDKSLDGTEAWSGIMKLRAKMASLATGNVLEVAVGTGRNVGYYDWGALFPKTPADVLRRKAKKNCQLTSYTAVDISSDMLEVANEKLHEAVLLHDQPIPSIKVIHGDLDTEVAGCLEYANGAIRSANLWFVQCLKPTITVG